MPSELDRRFQVVAYDFQEKPVRTWAGGTESQAEMLACDLRKQFWNLRFEVEPITAQRRGG